jgi:hypothetical protein
LLAAAGALGPGGCATHTTPAATRMAPLRGAPLPLRDDPTVRGVRLVPEDLHAAHVWGAEPNGGRRASVGGVRLLVAGGAVQTAAERLPGAPSSVVEVPERMGGGLLFLVGSQIWRSETWLDVPRPLLRTPSAVGDVFLGLDRAYLSMPGGTLAAFDPRTGAPEGIGALPAAPRMGRLAALDAWRAVAIGDFVGAMLTLDAGASWRPLDLAGEPVDVSTVTGSLVVRTLDASRQAETWEVEPDGQPLRLGAQPTWVSARGPGVIGPLDLPATPLGPDSLAAAIEDGWPLADGTALVARDGTLARVRLDDGTVIEAAPGAFDLRPARCHPLSLATGSDPGAFGFVCGEAGGRTALFRWDSRLPGLSEIRRFAEPRQVLAFSNGALAVRGACDVDAPGPTGDAPTGDRAWCVMAPSGRWSERRFHGDGAERARLVVLSDGGVALVLPPELDLATGRVTIAYGESATHVPLHFPLLRDDVARALLHGIWLDGFEERKRGVLSGWVDAMGAVVGVEIALDGTVRVGEYIRDAGAPVASGRWAFGWTASRRAFETTDGGMTWTKGIDVPEPITGAGAGRERVCGPVGCIAAGWLRVGWSSASSTDVPVVAPPLWAPRTMRTPPPIRLECERLPVEQVGLVTAPNAPRASFAQPAFVGAGAPLPGFCGKPASPRPTDASAVVAEIDEGVGWPRRASPVGFVYTWGPDRGDWDKLGRWEIRWRSAWGGCGSSTGPAPWSSQDAALRSLGRSGPSSALTLVGGDDPGRALLAVARRPAGFDLLALDAGRPPRPIHRADGDVFPDILSAVPFASRWYVASSSPPSQVGATVVWEIDGDSAREIGRLPRAGPEGHATLRLARRAGGRGLALIVEGRPDATMPGRMWLVTVDPSTGETRAPEALAPLDLGGRPPAACTGDEEGWEVEIPYGGPVELSLAPGAWLPAQSPTATLRLVGANACLERVVGFASDDATTAAVSPTGRLTGGRVLDVALVSRNARMPFRCRFP